MDGSESGSASVVTADDVLAHFGVKGMRWGVRRSEKISSGPVEPTAKVSRRTGVIDTHKTRGGEGFDAHNDAKVTARSKQIAKKSGTQALSTKELQDLVSRMNLEQQYSKLAASKENPGKKFVQDLVVSEGKSYLKGKPGPAVSLIGAALGTGSGKHRKK